MKIKEILKFNKLELPINSFYHSLHIYLKKPQVVNRKLSFASNISLFKISSKSENLLKILESCESIENVADILKLHKIQYENESLDVLSNQGHFNEHNCFISIDKITSKSNNSCFQMTLIGKNIL